MLQTIKADMVKVGDEVLFSNCPPQKVKATSLEYYPSCTFVMIKTMGGNCFPINVNTLICVNR